MRVDKLFILFVKEEEEVAVEEIEAGGAALYTKYTKRNDPGRGPVPGNVARYKITYNSFEDAKDLQIVHCDGPNDLAAGEPAAGTVGVYVFGHGSGGNLLGVSEDGLAAIFEKLKLKRIDKLCFISCALANSKKPAGGHDAPGKTYLERICTVLAGKDLKPKIAGYTDFVTIVPAAELPDIKIKGLDAAGYQQNQGRKAIKLGSGKIARTKDATNERKLSQKLVYVWREGGVANLDYSEWTDKH